MLESSAVTTITNAFYRNANAASYASVLFTGSASTAAASTARQSVSSSESETGVSTAAQKALARITEILALGNGTADDGAGVSETYGYITSATGTEDDDKLTLTGRAVSNLTSGGGDDTVMIKSDTVSNIDSGEGNDTLQIKGELINDIQAGSGDDKIELAAKLVLDVSGGDGNDDIKVSGDTLINIDGGDGDDRMYLEGNRIFASGGAGNDTVTIHQTGKDSVAEYTFGKGDGQDTVASDGSLSVRFDGYTEDDLSISVIGNVLTARVKGSDDKISVTLANEALNDGKLTYAFAMDQGQTVLKIG
ncbi:RTX toxin [Neorhizobium alkalisoli]|uniref:RTX toxin n=1 Tax=Neorhizobium alkalisoli TaxID=528178 RepID=UPI00119D168C|nr:RTX toxin [Neorhizobium alkalisoli]